MASFEKVVLYNEAHGTWEEANVIPCPYKFKYVPLIGTNPTKKEGVQTYAHEEQTTVEKLEHAQIQQKLTRGREDPATEPLTTFLFTNEKEVTILNLCLLSWPVS